MKLKKLFQRSQAAGDGPAVPVEDRLREVLDRLDAITSELEHLKLTNRLLPAVIRKLYLNDMALPPPFDLSAERFGMVSQNDEDGMILALFKRIGTTDRRFVEIGCGFNGGNSGFLARELGWSGLMIDARQSAIGKIAVKYRGCRVTPLRRKVTRESINGMLEKFGFTGEMDFLSIDVDGVDFWLWDELQVCRPRVLVIEYNYLFGSDHAVTIPYDPEFDLSKAPTRTWRGASLLALVRLGRRKGYRLVATERVNAFFVRDDVGSDVPACDVGLAYRGPENRPKGDLEKVASRELSLVVINEDGTPGPTVSAETLL